MEKALVTFKDLNSDKEIGITFRFNKDTNEVDYDVKLDESYSNTSTMDFIGFLAESLLLSLKIED